MAPAADPCCPPHGTTPAPIVVCDGCYPYGAVPAAAPTSPRHVHEESPKNPSPGPRRAK
jgi:hypothetical protein